jgi:hypothetical protein
VGLYSFHRKVKLANPSALNAYLLLKILLDGCAGSRFLPSLLADDSDDAV